MCIIFELFQQSGLSWEKWSGSQKGMDLSFFNVPIFLPCLWGENTFPIVLYEVMATSQFMLYLTLLGHYKLGTEFCIKTFLYCVFPLLIVTSTPKHEYKWNIIRTGAHSTILVCTYDVHTYMIM